MKKATNDARVAILVAMLDKLSTVGNPWSPSERDRALAKIAMSDRTPILAVEPGKMYIVAHSITIYENEHGRGEYFQRGAFVVFEPNGPREGTLNVTVLGNTFRVTSNPGFANQSATWVSNFAEATGFCNIGQTLGVVEIEVAIRVIST